MTPAGEPVTIRLGATNVYLVPERDGGRVAIDAGADYEGAWDDALAQMAAAGVDPRSVHTVLITHGHLDHCGLVRGWQGLGARVQVSAADTQRVRHGGRDPEPVRRRILDFLTESGVPLDLLGQRPTGDTRARLNQGRDGATDRLGNLHSIRPEHGVWPGPLQVVPAEPDGVIAATPIAGPAGAPAANEGGDAEWAAQLTAWLCPGHTPGSVIFFDDATGDLYTGDHLLEKIAPTPAVAFDARGERIRSLPSYLRALEATTRLAPTRVQPGHGQPFTDLAGAIRRTVGVFEQRGARLHRRLGDRPASAWEIAQRLYPHLRLSAAWLAIAEICGLLDLLEERGEVVLECADGLRLYRKV